MATASKTLTFSRQISGQRIKSTSKQNAERRRAGSFAFPVQEKTELRWLASPTFSKNMKSCKETTQRLASGKACYRRALEGGTRSLTIRKQAPSRTAFIFTSMSSGNWMPKLSVSVKTSFRRPLHCLLMRPMGLLLSLPFSCGATNQCDPRAKKINSAATKNADAPTSKLTSPQQLQAKQGPSSFRSVSLLAPWMEKRGRQGCQSCLMYPTVVPGGAWTSICGHTHRLFNSG